MYIAAGQGQTTPGDKTLVTPVICYKLKKISLKSDFIHFFMILYMYIVTTDDRRWTDRRRTTEAYLSYKLTNEPSAQMS